MRLASGTSSPGWSRAQPKYEICLLRSLVVSQQPECCNTNGKELRWLKTVPNIFVLIGRYNHSLSLDYTIMKSKNCPVIGQHVAIIFVAQWVTIATL